MHIHLLCEKQPSHMAYTPGQLAQDLARMFKPFVAQRSIHVAKRLTADTSLAYIYGHKFDAEKLPFVFKDDEWRNDWGIPRVAGNWRDTGLLVNTPKIATVLHSVESSSSSSTTEPEEGKVCHGLPPSSEIDSDEE